MKRREIKTISALVAITLLTGISSVSSGVQGVTYEVISGSDGKAGGGVKLFWSEAEGGGGCFGGKVEYVLILDGVEQEPIEDTFFAIKTPCAEVEVVPYVDGEAGASSTVTFKAVQTSELAVSSVDQPGAANPAGFGFIEDGTAAAYTLYSSDKWPDVDFYVEGVEGEEGKFVLASPSEREPEPFNDKQNAISLESGSYDDLETVLPAAAASYAKSREIEEASLFGLWMDKAGDGYSADDHFAKAEVTTVSGDKVVFKLAYQTVPGLRWVVVE